MVSVAEQLEILRRGVEAITPEPEFVKKLESSVATGQPLRVKYGIDPTGIDVHLGHTVPLRKLRQFQELGHKAIIIIGNYTALVGDPSGRDETRMALSEERVEANAKTYLEQVGKIIDLESAEVHRNGDWFGKWSFLEVLELCRRMTLGQITAREDFSKRMKEEKPVYLHECLYPLMQGWDSVEIKADVELGGTEQLFSLLVARNLQQEQGQAPQVAITLPILVGTDGTRRMGKSLGNYVGVGESAEQQYGKVMSIPDEPIRQYFTLLTDVSMEEVDELLAPGKNPRDAKDLLARKVVGFYHGAAPAEQAAGEFRRRAAGEDPSAIAEETISPRHLDESGRATIVRLLRALGMESSNSSARRQVQQGAVRIGPEREVVRDIDARVRVDDGLVVRVGKRGIKRVRLGVPTWIYCATAAEHNALAMEALLREFGVIWCPPSQSWPGDPAPGDPVYCFQKAPIVAGKAQFLGRGSVLYTTREGGLSNLFWTNADVEGVSERARELGYGGPDNMRFLRLGDLKILPAPGTVELNLANGLSKADHELSAALHELSNSSS